MQKRIILPAAALVVLAAGCGSSDAPDAAADPDGPDQDIAQADPGTGHDDPLPIDASLVFEDWVVSVPGVDLDATEGVTEFTAENTGPEDGFEYVVFSLEFTYLGEDQANPSSEFDFAVWADAVRHDDGCGLIPDDLAQTTDDEGLTAGETLTADSCVQVPTDLITSQLVLEVHLDSPIRDEDTGYLLISQGS